MSEQGPEGAGRRVLPQWLIDQAVGLALHDGASLAAWLGNQHPAVVRALHESPEFCLAQEMGIARRILERDGHAALCHHFERNVAARYKEAFLADPELGPALAAGERIVQNTPVPEHSIRTAIMLARRDVRAFARWVDALDPAAALALCAIDGLEEARSTGDLLNTASDVLRSQGPAALHRFYEQYVESSPVKAAWLADPELGPAVATGATQAEAALRAHIDVARRILATYGAVELYHHFATVGAEGAEAIGIDPALMHQVTIGRFIYGARPLVAGARRDDEFWIRLEHQLCEVAADSRRAVFQAALADPVIEKRTATGTWAFDENRLAAYATLEVTEVVYAHQLADTDPAALYAGLQQVSPATLECWLAFDKIKAAHAVGLAALQPREAEQLMRDAGGPADTLPTVLGDWIEGDLDTNGA